MKVTKPRSSGRKQVNKIINPATGKPLSAYELSLMVSELECVQGVQKNVLRALADHYPNAWPSIPTLARKSGWSERPTRYAVRVLEKEEWMTALTSKKGGRALSTQYKINARKVVTTFLAEKAAREVGYQVENPAATAGFSQETRLLQHPLLGEKGAATAGNPAAESINPAATAPEAVNESIMSQQASSNGMPACIPASNSTSTAASIRNGKRSKEFVWPEDARKANDRFAALLWEHEHIWLEPLRTAEQQERWSEILLRDGAEHAEKVCLYWIETNRDYLDKDPKNYQYITFVRQYEQANSDMKASGWRPEEEVGNP